MNTPTNAPIDRSFCVAPMMKCTDRYFRQLARIMTRRTMLYTEMLSCKAVIHGHARGILDYDPKEQPLALQIGGRDSAEMREATELAARWGYAEVNINAGCPSQCATAGGFGAALMKEAEHLAECVQAMQASTDLPVTIKCRTGVEGCDSESALFQFVDTTARAGCQTFIVHARSAILGKLSPKQNRNIPPLDYERVYRLKEAFPELEIIINGGIQDLDAAQAVRQNLDGVMLGRAVYDNPLMLLDVDHLFYGEAAARKGKGELTKEVLSYIEQHLSSEVPRGKIFKHIMSLFKSQRHARKWRRWLSESALQKGDSHAIIEQLQTGFDEMALD